jgi:hypothetical protein
MFKQVNFKKIVIVSILAFMFMGSTTAVGWYVPDLDSDSSGMLIGNRGDLKVMPGDNIRYVRSPILGQYPTGNFKVIIDGVGDPMEGSFKRN